MAEEHRLRPVPPSSEATPHDPTTKSALDTLRHWLANPLLWVIVLGVVLILVSWNRSQLSGRIQELEAETQNLRKTVSQQNHIIEAQSERLDSVRDRIDSLRTLLHEPLPTRQSTPR